MKVLVLGNANGLGGAQTSFRRLIEFLIEDGFRLGVIAIADENNWLEIHSNIEMKCHLSFSANKLSKSLEIGKAALKARTFAPDVFISVGLSKSACLIAKGLSLSTFKLCQDFIFGRSANDDLLLKSTKAFDAFAVQAPSMIAPLKNNGFNAIPLDWLPCFPELPFRDLQQHTNRSRIPKRLAYFGRLAANKGIDLLLKAYSLARFNCTVELDIWGTGPERKYLETVATSLGLESNVKFNGPYPDGLEAARLMCEYDGLMLTSTCTEGLPLILLEAMAYGIPFLASDIGAIRDCCIENSDSILVRPTENDVRVGLEKFISALIENRFNSERLVQYYKLHFSYEIMAERWKRFLVAPNIFFS